MLVSRDVVVGLGAVQPGGAAAGHGFDRGVVAVDGDGVLLEGNGHDLAGVHNTDLDALSGDLDAAVDGHDPFHVRCAG
jgi:hypothetical protein